MKYYEISETAARASHEMMSMSDYKPGSATASYHAAVDEAAALVEKRKEKVSPFYHDKLDALLDSYARRLAKWHNDYNRNGASCPSVLICGPANFPTRKKARQNARNDSLMEEYKEIEAILDKIKAVGTGPVDLADPHAREILMEQLEKARTAHQIAKAGNAYYRKNHTLDGCPGITPEDEEWLNRPGVFNAGEHGTPLELYGCPFPAYEITSRLEKVKRVQARLEELERLQAQRENPADASKFNGGEIVRNAELNRLQILFDEIPDADTRAKLKANGFRWSPKNQAWQRQLTRNAEVAARQVLGLA
jgi:hypothetical protein